MEKNDLSDINAGCIIRLVDEEISIMKEKNIQMMIAINDQTIFEYVKNVDKIYSHICSLLERKNYRKALIFICLLHREVEKISSYKDGKKNEIEIEKAEEFRSMTREKVVSHKDASPKSIAAPVRKKLKKQIKKEYDAASISEDKEEEDITSPWICI